MKAGIPGQTENITIKSIVGRYLEHSRIYIFGTGSRQKIFISSADFMTRNTERRVEVATPIFSPAEKEKILKIVEVLRSDNVKTRIQLPSGEYRHLHLKEGERKIDSQIEFYRQAYAAAKATRRATSETKKNSIPFLEKIKKTLFKK